MDLKKQEEYGLEAAGGDMDQLRVLPNTVTDLRFPKQPGNLLAG